MTLGERTDLSNVAIYLNWKHFYSRFLVYILLFVTHNLRTNQICLIVGYMFGECLT